MMQKLEPILRGLILLFASSYLQGCSVSGLRVNDISFVSRDSNLAPGEYKGTFEGRACQFMFGFSGAIGTANEQEALESLLDQTERCRVAPQNSGVTGEPIRYFTHVRVRSEGMFTFIYNYLCFYATGRGYQ